MPNKASCTRPKSSANIKNGTLLVLPITSERNMAWSSASEQELTKNPTVKLKQKLSRSTFAPICASGKRYSMTMHASNKQYVI